MAADAALIGRIDELIARFNRRSLDLPDGLFDRQTQFLLNGTPYEEMLGRAAGDPLALMIARGPAGYRFAVKALQHAVPDGRISRGDVEPDSSAPAGAWRVPLWLSGHLRGSGELVEAVMLARVTTRPMGPVSRADLHIEEAMTGRLRAARLRE